MTDNVLDELHWQPAHVLADHVRAGRLSVTEVVRTFVTRLERLEPQLHSFITIDDYGALERARELDCARDLRVGNSLLGVPYSAKDNIFTTKLRTTLASRLFESFVPAQDALVIRRTDALGAVMLGKANLPEFSSWGRSGNMIAGECRNPWDTTRTCGASSGGSGAAVAAGLVPLSIGSDDGGSIRLPAALNGVYGLYPSPGVVPMDGCVIGGPVSAVGPLTRDVRDAALFLDGMRARTVAPGQSYSERLDQLPAGLKIAWISQHASLPTTDPRVVEVARQAAHQLLSAGVAVDEPDVALLDNLGGAVATPDPDISRYGGLLPSELPGMKAITADPNWVQLLSPYIDPARLTAQAPSGRPTGPAEEGRRAIVEQMTTIFADYDLLLTPTIDQVAPKIPDDWTYPYGPPETAYRESHYGPSIQHYVKYTMRANLAGCPAASVPAGFVEGMPVGLMVIGRPRQDLLVLQVSRALEQIIPWAGTHPALP